MSEEEALALISEAAQGRTRLDLSGLGLTRIPASLRSLTHLVELDLGGNGMAELPEWLGELTKLESLMVSANPLETLPDAVSSLGRLKLLHASGCKLTSLPRLGRLNMVRLDLSDNRLAALPESLGDLGDLDELYLSGNRLTALPESVGNLSRLKRIELRYNMLTAVPEALRRMLSLTALDLAHNRLTELPSWLRSLNRLTDLNLSGNPLTAIPPSLGHLPILKALTLADIDGLTSPPPSVVAQGTQAVLAFLRGLTTRDGRQWRSKLLVVGQGRAGKTSMVKALSGLPHDAKEPTTHGLNVTQLDLDHPRPDAVGGPVTMQLAVWDFGGQDIYYATHQFFLTGHSLFVLVWSSGAGYEHSRLRYWLDLIGAREPGAPIIVVATQTAERAPDLPQAELAAAYPSVRAWINVDNATGDGIEELRHLIAQQAAGLPLMGGAWPSTWLIAHEASRKLSGTYVSLPTFDAQIEQAGIADLRERSAFTGALHQLGEILHYTHDRELNELVVLQPQWLSGRISEILDSKPVEERSGLLHHQDIAEHWSDLSPELRRHLLSMMDTFDVSYRVEDTEVAAIVVERLPWNPPDYQEDWAKLAPPFAKQIRLRYTIDGTIPPGIPTWFIARSHRFSTPRFRPWRTGAIRLHHDGKHLGLIQVDLTRNTIELAVRGPLPAAFFSLLDDGLRLTFGRYPGLRLTASVPCICADDCTTHYAYDKLLLRAERGITSVECDSSLERVSVSELLYGFTTAGSGDELQRFGELIQQLKGNSELLQREFLKLAAAGHARCPRIFTVTKTKTLKPGQTDHQIQLYCEEPGSWHPVDSGIYTVPDLAKWRAVLNRAHDRTARVLNLTSSVAAATGIPVAALPLVDGKPTVRDLGALQRDPDDSWSMPSVRAETDAEYRALEQLLTELDPKHRWGGLSKITTPEGLILFLCPEHLARYTTPQPPHSA